MLGVCLEHTCSKHNLHSTKHVIIFLSPYLCLGPDLVSEGRFGTANWHSCALTLSGRYSLEQGKGFFGNAVWSAHETAKHMGQKSFSASIRGQEISTSCMEAWSCVRCHVYCHAKWQQYCAEVLIPDHGGRLLLQQLSLCEQSCKTLWQKAARLMPAAQLIQAKPGKSNNRDLQEQVGDTLLWHSSFHSN